MKPGFRTVSSGIIKCCQDILFELMTGLFFTCQMQSTPSLDCECCYKQSRSPTKHRCSRLVSEVLEQLKNCQCKLKQTQRSSKTVPERHHLTGVRHGCDMTVSADRMRGMLVIQTMLTRDFLLLCHSRGEGPSAGLQKHPHMITLHSPARFDR